MFATDGVYPDGRLFRMDSFQQMCFGVPPADVILSLDPVEIVSPADVFRCCSSRFVTAPLVWLREVLRRRLDFLWYRHRLGDM